jgi:hypothetical protein
LNSVLVPLLLLMNYSITDSDTMEVKWLL